MSSPFYEAVHECSIALARGGLLKASDVTAGGGLVVDWRTIKSGEIMIADASFFDVAHLFVNLVGEFAAYQAAELVLEKISRVASAAEPWTYRS